MAKHIAFVNMPAHGHINPTLPLVAELVSRGHRVSYATGEEWREQLLAVGAEPISVPFHMPQIPSGGLKFDAETMRDRIGEFFRSVSEVFPVLIEHYGSDRPDILCADAMAPVGTLVARKLDVPFTALHPTHASNEHFSLRASVMKRQESEPDAETNRAIYDAFQEMGNQVKEFAMSQGLDGDINIFEQVSEDNLVFIPREFQIQGETFDDRYTFLGPTIGERTDSGQWHAPGESLLFISLGTVFNARADFYQRCLEAFADTDWHVAMSIGSNVDPAELGTIPANFDIRERFPQLDVLREASAFISHCGMNSTMEALYFGVPVIGVPQQPEQQANAERCVELGYGTCLNADDVTAEQLREAVTKTTADPDVRANLAAISERLQERSGAVVGADALLARIG